MQPVIVHKVTVENPIIVKNTRKFARGFASKQE
jgi:hypothetical protein